MNLKVFCLLFFSVTALHGQQKFKASVVMGVTASQLGGDSLSGYDKLGLSTGLKLTYDLNNLFDLNLDMLYTQRGSRSTLGFSNSGTSATALDYLELPFYVGINDWYIEKEDYHKVGAFLGLSYAYLFSVRTSNNILQGQEGAFNKHDFGPRLGLYYSFFKNLTFRVYYTDSFLNVLDSDQLFQTNALDSFNWTFRIEYNL